jgi:hypothetical protein
MSRGLILNLMASALTILATIAFLGATLVVNATPMIAPAADVRPVVHAFYDAINAVLRTGDPTAFEGVVAPNFVMHGALEHVSPDRDGLVHQLVATSGVNPTLHLEIADLEVVGNRALVQVTRTDRAGGAFLGVPFATSPVLWGQFDALRIEGGHVTELWSGGEHVPLFEPLRQAWLDPLLTAEQAMMFRRITTAAGEPWNWAATHQSRVLYLEAGTIMVEVDRTSPEAAVIFPTDGDGRGRPVAPGGRALLRPGDALAISPFVRYNLSGGGPAHPELLAYEVAFPRFPGAQVSGPELAGGVVVATPARSTLPTRGRLAEVADPSLPHAPLLVTFGRITLPPGTPLALSASPGPVLLTVEAGTLGIDVWHAEPAAVKTKLASGEATIIPAGEASTFQVVGTEPVVLFTTTILPAFAGTRVVPSSTPSPVVSPETPFGFGAPLSWQLPLLPPGANVPVTREEQSAGIVRLAGEDLRHVLSNMALQSRRQYPTFLGTCPCPAGGSTEAAKVP